MNDCEDRMILCVRKQNYYSLNKYNLKFDLLDFQRYSRWNPNSNRSKHGTIFGNPLLSTVFSHISESSNSESIYLTKKHMKAHPNNAFFFVNLTWQLASISYRVRLAFVCSLPRRMSVERPVWMSRKNVVFPYCARARWTSRTGGQHCKWDNQRCVYPAGCQELIGKHIILFLGIFSARNKLNKWFFSSKILFYIKKTNYIWLKEYSCSKEQKKKTVLQQLFMMTELNTTQKKLQIHNNFLDIYIYIINNPTHLINSMPIIYLIG